MINRPTAQEILFAIREELRSVVAPATNDAGAQMTLGLIDALLGLVCGRLTDDLRVASEELEALERITGPIDPAVPVYRGSDAIDRFGPLQNQLIERYYAASQLVADLLEDEQHPDHVAATEILHERLRCELQTAGTLFLVGRIGAEVPASD